MKMAYDEGLAQRLRELFEERPDVVEKKMFGGLCFMVANHMCCGIVGDSLMVRVGAEKYEECLDKQFTREMDFTGKAMTGLIYVLPAGFESEEGLNDWVSMGIRYVESLPPRA